MVFNRIEGKKLTHHNNLQYFIRAKCFCLLFLLQFHYCFSEDKIYFLLLKDINLRNGQIRYFLGIYFGCVIFLEFILGALVHIRNDNVK